MILTAFALAAAASQPASPALIETAIEAPGPLAALKGTMLAPAGRRRAVMLLLPGSGPTDRDGNNPMGIRAAPYRLLAEGLAGRGIATVRADKRGIAGSAKAVGNANEVRIADYVGDVQQWVKAIRARTGARCVWVEGHSEGGLIALAAAQRPEGICGIVLIAAPGRKLGEVLREQLKANPANAPVLPQALAALDALEAGRRVDTAGMHPALMPLFAPQIQGYLIDLLAHDPAALAARVRVPMLIVQGDRDIQARPADARALAAANPRAKLVVITGANHVLKSVASDDRAANVATYADPSLPLAPGIVDAIAKFVTAR
jgi:pimeloyl-ACP methyl ester carboxylesterase